MSCFPAIPLNRTKLKYETMNLKAYEKIIWMISSVKWIRLGHIIKTQIMQILTPIFFAAFLTKKLK